MLGGVIGGQMKVVVPPAFISSCDDGKTGWKVKGLLFFSFSLLHILPHTPVSHQAYYGMTLKLHLDSSYARIQRKNKIRKKKKKKKQNQKQKKEGKEKRGCRKRKTKVKS